MEKIENRPFHISFHAAFGELKPNGETEFCYYPGAYPARLSKYLVLGKHPTEITLAEIHDIVRNFFIKKYNQKTVTIQFDSPVQDSDLKYTLKEWHDTLSPEVTQAWTRLQLAGEWTITALLS